MLPYANDKSPGQVTGPGLFLSPAAEKPATGFRLPYRAYAHAKGGPHNFLRPVAIRVAEADGNLARQVTNQVMQVGKAAGPHKIHRVTATKTKNSRRC
jgi:hypothetical protein